MLKLIDYNNDLPIRLDVMTIQEYPWHTHNDLQIIYVIDGIVELKMTYERFHLERENLHLIHPQDVHGIKGLTENNLVLILSFNMAFFLERYPELDKLIFTTRVNENVTTYKDFLTIKSLFFSIAEELLNENINYKKNICELSFRLIDILYRSFQGFTINTEKHNIEHKVPHDPVQIERISHVISYIYNHYPYKISLTDIAQSENLSKYYLSHLFQTIVGISFRDFVSTVRVEVSELELLTTNTSIAQISENVGFSNAKYYIKNFENWFGMHPKEYRQHYHTSILGECEIKAITQPFNVINDILKNNRSTFGFQNSAIPVSRAVYHCTPITLNRNTGTDCFDPEKLYSDYNPHTECIATIKKYIKSHNLTAPQPPTFDSFRKRNGFHTPNGMRKPLYWVYQFLNSQTTYSLQTGNHYYMSTNTETDTINLIVFNETNTDHLFEFEFQNAIAQEYKITEHKLHANNSCITYWKQLGLNKKLSQSDIDHINRMSSPEIAFQRIISKGLFTYSLLLMPYDICHIEISAIT